MWTINGVSTLRCVTKMNSLKQGKMNAKKKPVSICGSAALEMVDLRRDARLPRVPYIRDCDSYRISSLLGAVSERHIDAA